MIRFNQVNKTYPGGFLALKNVSFHLAAGEMAFLTGHSGAGKSTLLKLISLIEKPSSGSILINNKQLANISYRQVPFHSSPNRHDFPKPPFAHGSHSI